MKYKKAWKLCANCMRSYVAPEYSLNCPECRKEIADKIGKSVATARNYEKQIWSEQDTKKDWEWTLIGLWDDATETFQIQYVYDNWPDDLKELIAKEQEK